MRFKTIKIKAWNAAHSMAMGKFHNAEIDCFGRKLFVHDLIRGSLELAFCRVVELVEFIELVIGHGLGIFHRVI
jgi:hypothetical protein